jgi:predicted transcriptional regulator
MHAFLIVHFVIQESRSFWYSFQKYSNFDASVSNNNKKCNLLSRNGVYLFVYRNMNVDKKISKIFSKLLNCFPKSEHDKSTSYCRLAPGKTAGTM